MEKRFEIKRLLIYLAFSFGLTWLWFFVFMARGYRWELDDSRTTVVSLGMLFPFISNILTRFVTKEGFAMTGKDSLMLGISFRNKKWIIYLLVMFLPWFYRELANVLFLVISPEAFDANYYEQVGISKEIVLMYPMAIIISSMTASFAALGEEGGWRGYMMPKLRNIMGYKKAVLVGGIIWGLWHAPLTCIGHNYGTDYPGFPYLGIVLMCVSCTFMGIILSFVTEKTQSIWPATILHAVNNGGPSILQFFINEEIIDGKFGNSIAGPAIYQIPQAMIAIICFVIVCKEEK